MSAQLRELFDGAAESQPPHDLAARAVASARSRRRQRYTVAGSVLAAAAVVLGFVMIGSSERLDGAPRPNEVAGLPDQLPAADGLPTLTADSMPFASAAYVVDGKVVVVDAATGDGALVDLDTTPPGYVGTPILGIGPGASLALSPDGRFLLASSGKTDLEPGGREWVWLVDVATGVATPQSFELAPASEASAVLLNRMAWSPTGQMFACICSGPGRAQLWTANMSEVDADLVVNSLSGTDVAPTQISWGTDGLVAQLTDLDPEWRLVPVGGFSRANPGTWPPLESVSMLGPGAVRFSAVAMGHSDEGGFLAKLALGKGGSGALWVVPEDGQYRTVESVPSRPWLGALGDSYFVVLTDWKGDPYNEEVDRIDGEGETVLTTLPPGATTISFASELVG